MSTKIIKTIKYFDGQILLKSEMVKKKSNWLKAWRRRKILLLSNRIQFHSDEQMKTKPTISVDLIDILKIKNHESNPLIMIIQTNVQNYEIQFTTPKSKQLWKDNIVQAIRDFKIKKSQMISDNHPINKKDGKNQEVKACGLGNFF